MKRNLGFGLVLGLKISAILSKCPTLEGGFFILHEQTKYKIIVSAHSASAVKS